MFASMTTCGLFALLVFVFLVAVLSAPTVSSETCTASSCWATVALSDVDVSSVEDADADAVRFSLIQKASPQLLQSATSAEVEKVARHEVEEESLTSKAKTLANGSSPEVQQHDVKVQNRSNQSAELRQSQSLSELVLNEIEFELYRADVSGKSKLVLALLEGLALGFLGIDRCYLGQCCIGIVKGITFGGFGIWFLIDYFIVVFNSLEKKDSISTFGFNASFMESTITSAFWVSLVFLVLMFLSFFCGGRKRGSS